jgi:hypothetical protein
MALSRPAWSMTEAERRQLGDEPSLMPPAAGRGGRGMPGGGRGADTPANTKLPTIVWLHGYSYQLGYICRISRRIT